MSTRRVQKNYRIDWKLTGRTGQQLAGLKNFQRNDIQLLKVLQGLKKRKPKQVADEGKTKPSTQMFHQLKIVNNIGTYEEHKCLRRQVFNIILKEE